MSGLDSIGQSDRGGDPRLLAHVLSATPAWAWNAEGTRILWANPPGAEIFKASTQDALSKLRFPADDLSGSQIAKLADNLPATGVWRLERLRGFGAAVGGVLTCQCMRIDLAGEAAMLVVSGERTGPNMPFDTRLRRV